MKLDLNLIKVFLEVYQYHSYTLASEVLDITQPAVSAAVKRLEKEVGERLFIREGRSMKPTAIAIRLADRFQKGIDEIQNAFSDRFKYTVYMSEALSFDLASLPNVVFEQAPSDQKLLINNIRNLSVDFAIGVFLVKDASIVIEPIYTEPTVVICRQQHPRINGSLSKQQFYAEEHVALATTWNGMDGFEHISLDTQNERTVSCKMGAISGLLLQASKSDLLAVVSQKLARQWQEELSLQVLDNPIEHKYLEYQLAYHRRYQHLENHKIIRNKIKQLLQKQC